MLPHAYPFRFLDRVGDDGVVVLVSSGATALRGGAELPPLLALEILAQAALVTLAPPAPAEERVTSHPGAIGLLAGVEGLRLDSAVRAGDRLVASVALLARFGSLSKVRAELRRGETIVAAAELLLASS